MALYSLSSATVRIVDARAGDRAGADDLHVATPLAGQQFGGGQLLVRPIRVGAGQIDLVQGDDDRDPGGPGVADGLFGLGHDAVVGGHDEDRDVGAVGAAGAHLREGFVARRVDKCDRPSVLLDPVGADVLRDPTLFGRDNVDVDDPVEQGGLAVVDVAEKRDHRGAGLERRGVVLDVVESFHQLLFGRGRLAEIDLDLQGRGQQFGGLQIELVGDAEELFILEEFALHVGHGQPEALREALDGAGQVDHDIVLSGRGGAHIPGAAEPAGQAGRNLFLVACSAPRRGGAGSFTLQLALLAPAQGAASIAERAGCAFASLAAILAALPGLRQRGAGLGLDRLLGRRLALLLVLAELFRKRPSTGLAGPQGAGRQAQVGLLGARLFLLFGGGSFRRRHRGELDRQPPLIGRTAAALLARRFLDRSALVGAGPENRNPLVGGGSGADVVLAAHGTGWPRRRRRGHRGWDRRLRRRRGRRRGGRNLFGGWGPCRGGRRLRLRRRGRP